MPGCWGHHPRGDLPHRGLHLGFIEKWWLVISPIVAALFHVSGSLLVVFNSFRLIRQGEEFEPHESTSLPALAGAPA